MGSRVLCAPVIRSGIMMNRLMAANNSQMIEHNGRLGKAGTHCFSGMSATNTDDGDKDAGPEDRFPVKLSNLKYRLISFRITPSLTSTFASVKESVPVLKESIPVLKESIPVNLNRTVSARSETFDNHTSTVDPRLQSGKLLAFYPQCDPDNGSSARKSPRFEDKS